MKLLFTVFICISGLSLVAQTDLTYKKLSWGIRFAPGVFYRSLDFEKSQQQIELLRDKHESAAFGFTAGIHFLRRLGEKSIIEGGLSFSNSGYRIAKAPLQWEQPGTGLPSEATFRYRYQHLHLNAGYRREVLGSKMKLYVVPSFYGGVLLQRKTVVKTAGPDDTHQSTSKTRGGYREGDFGMQLAAGITFRLPARFILSLQLYYRRSLTSVLAGSANNEFLYAFGLETQLYRVRISKRY